MNLVKYNSFLMALVLFYSIMPLVHKFFPLAILKPEIILIAFSFPLVFSLKKSQKKAWFIALIYIIFVIYSFLGGLNYPKSIYEFYIRMVPFGLFPMVVGTLTINKVFFNRFLLIFCNLNFFLLAYLVVFRQDMYSNKEFMNYMTFGYWLLPSVLFYMYFYLIEKNYIYLILNFAGIILVFMFGSRFSFLLSFLGSSLMIFQFVDGRKKRIITGALFFIIPLLTLIYNNLREIILFLIETLSKFRISTLSLRRILFSIEGDTSTILTGRDIVFEKTIDWIYKNPMGIGIFGFKKIPSFSEMDIFYPHNIFLEILLHFGIIGILIFLVINFFIFYKLIKIENKEKKILIILLYIMNLKLLLTGSYLWEPYFWVLSTLIVSLKNLE